MGWDLAALLLILHPDAPVPPESPQLYNALVRQAWALDLAYPWENWQSWRSEVAWCRNYYRTMQEYPHSWEHRLYNHEHAADWLTFQAKRWEYAVNVGDQAVADDLSRRIEVYQRVMCATRPGSVSWDRRWELQQLRCLIGHDDFYAGRLPDPVPMWAFREVGR